MAEVKINPIKISRENDEEEDSNSNFGNGDSAANARYSEHKTSKNKKQKI